MKIEPEQSIPSRSGTLPPYGDEHGLTIRPNPPMPSDDQLRAIARNATGADMTMTDEQREAFRKMDALAATGEDTPEYRAAFAAWAATHGMTPDGAPLPDDSHPGGE